MKILYHILILLTLTQNKKVKIEIKNRKLRNVKYGNIIVDIAAMANLWGLNFNLS